VSKGMYLAQAREKARRRNAAQRGWRHLRERDPKLWIIAQGFKAPRPGSNAMSMVELVDHETNTRVGGEEIETYLRAGILQARELDDRNMIVLKPDAALQKLEIPEVDLTHAYFLTPLGEEQVRAVMAEVGADL
jgi:hypothetical protein